MKFPLIICATLVGLGQAKAELNIVTDIAPVGSIVSQISGHNVTVLIKPGQSPHDASLKPSMARALGNADVVIWMGEAMAPGLAKPISQLASSAAVLELLEIEGINYLEARENAAFEDDHSDDDGHEDHEDHDEHKDHDDHVDEAKHDDHDDHHAHDGVDPHAWLSRAVVKEWMGAISNQLSKSSPENAEQYRMNAKVSITHTDQNYSDLGTILLGETAPETVSLKGTRPVVALHDAFQYLEASIGLNVVAAIRDGDGSSPSAARLSDVNTAVADNQPKCLIGEAAESGDAAQNMAQNLGLKLVPLDILGAQYEQGPDLYGKMMKDIAIALKGCL